MTGDSDDTQRLPRAEEDDAWLPGFQDTTEFESARPIFVAEHEVAERAYLSPRTPEWDTAPQEVVEGVAFREGMEWTTPRQSLFSSAGNPYPPEHDGYGPATYDDRAAHYGQPSQSVLPAAPRPEDLLLPNRPRVLDEPASWGLRGWVHRASGGLIKPAPSADEQADRQNRLDIKLGFSRPMTVVVIQPKGGAGKTPTTVGLAAALGVHRGGYVAGWDNNETRGTLGVRTANYDGKRSTVWDLLHRLGDFERPDARVGDLAHFVRSQGEAQFDALASDDAPSNMEQIGDSEFRRIHAVLERFYRLIVIDTGNNVRAPNWQAAVNQAELVVVVSTYQRDVGYSASWVLDHLSQTGRERLAREAVTVLTAADPHYDAAVRDELLDHFRARTQAVVEIPYDRHIAVGGPILWPQLQVQTQRAWLHGAATVVRALRKCEARDQ